MGPSRFERFLNILPRLVIVPNQWEKSLCQGPVLFANPGIDAAGVLNDFSIGEFVESPLDYLAEKSASGQTRFFRQLVYARDKRCRQTDYNFAYGHVYTSSILAEILV